MLLQHAQRVGIVPSNHLTRALSACEAVTRYTATAGGNAMTASPQQTLSPTVSYMGPRPAAVVPSSKWPSRLVQRTASRLSTTSSLPPSGPPQQMTAALSPSPSRLEGLITSPKQNRTGQLGSLSRRPTVAASTEAAGAAGMPASSGLQPGRGSGDEGQSLPLQPPLAAARAAADAAGSSGAPAGLRPLTAGNSRQQSFISNGREVGVDGVTPAFRGTNLLPVPASTLSSVQSSQALMSQLSQTLSRISGSQALPRSNSRTPTPGQVQNSEAASNASEHQSQAKQLRSLRTTSLQERSAGNHSLELLPAKHSMSRTVSVVPALSILQDRPAADARSSNKTAQPDDDLQPADGDASGLFSARPSMQHRNGSVVALQAAGSLQRSPGSLRRTPGSAAADVAHLSQQLGKFTPDGSLVQEAAAINESAPAAISSVGAASRRHLLIQNASYMNGASPAHDDRENEAIHHDGLNPASRMASHSAGLEFRRQSQIPAGAAPAANGTLQYPRSARATSDLRLTPRDSVALEVGRRSHSLTKATPSSNLNPMRASLARRYSQNIHIGQISSEEGQTVGADEGSGAVAARDLLDSRLGQENKAASISRRVSWASRACPLLPAASLRTRSNSAFDPGGMSLDAASRDSLVSFRALFSPLHSSIAVNCCVRLSITDDWA